MLRQIFLLWEPARGHVNSPRDENISEPTVSFTPARPMRLAYLLRHGVEFRTQSEQSRRVLKETSPELLERYS